MYVVPHSGNVWTAKWLSVSSHRPVHPCGWKWWSRKQSTLNPAARSALSNLVVSSSGLVSEIHCE